jgi:hypothetical protein
VARGVNETTQTDGQGHDARENEIIITIVSAPHEEISGMIENYNFK